MSMAMKDKFGGMMQAQSSTFEGMVSNLMDWKGQALRIAGEPIFNALKDQLAGLLTVLNSDQAQAGVLALGQGIASGINVALGALQSLAPIAQAAAGSVGFLADAFAAFQGGDVIGAVGQVLMAFGMMEDQAFEVAGSFEPIVSALSTVAATAQILGPALSEVFMGGEEADALAAAVSALSGGMSIFAPEAQVAGAAASSMGQALLAAANIAGIVAGTAQTLADIVSGVLVSAFQTAGQVAGVVWAGLPGLVLAAAGPLQTIAGVAGSILVAAFANVGSAIQVGLSLLPGLAATGMATLTALAGIVGGTLAGAFQALQGPAITVAQVVGSVLAGAFQALAGIATAVLNGLPGLFMAVSGPIQTIAGLAGGLLAAAFTAFGQIAQSVFAVLPGLASIVMAVLQQVAGVVSNVLAMAFALLAPLAQSVFQGIVTIVQMALPPFMVLAHSVGQLVVTAFQTLGQIAMAVFTAIQPYIPVLQQAIVYLATVIGSLLANTFLALSNIIQSIIIPAIQTLGNWFAQILPGLIGVAMSFITGVVIPIFIRLVSWLAEAIPGALNSLAGFWQTHGDQIVGIAQTAWNLIQSAVQTVLNTVGQLWSAWSSAREGDWRGFGEKLREIWDGAWNAIVNAVNTIGPQVVEAIKTLLGQARDAFTAIDWGQLGRDIIQGVVDGIRAGAGGLMEAARNAAQNLVNAARGALDSHSPSQVMAAVGRDVTAGLALGIVAGGPEAIGAMLNVASSVASVARQLVWTVKQFGDGMGDALKRLGRLGEGTDQVVAIIDNVATAVERLAKISQTSGFGAGATNVAYEISRLARGLIDATNMRGEGLGNEVERLKSLADGIQSVAGIAGSVKSALDSLKAAATFDLSGLDRLGEIFGRLAAWAAEMAQVGGEAAGAVTGMFVPALQTLATATGAASDVADRAFGLARLLVDALAFDWGATNWGAARDMLVGLVDLGEFLANAAGAAATQTTFATAGLDALKSALEPTAGVASSVLSLAALLVQALAFNWGATNWGVARDMLVGLVDLGEFLVTAAAQAASTFQGVGGNLANLQTALDPLAGLVNNVMDLAHGLVAALQYNWGGVNWGIARDMLVGLVDLAEFLIYHADVAASTYEDVGPELGRLRSALDTVIGIANGTMTLAEALVKALAIDWAATNWGEARDMLVGLVDLGEFLVYHANIAASSFQGVGPALGLLGAAIQNVIGVFQGVTDAVKLFATRVQPPPMDTALEDYITALVQFAYQVVNLSDRVIRSPLLEGALAFLTNIQTNDNPLTKLGTLLDQALGVFNNATDAVQAFKNRVMPPPMDAGLAGYIAALIQFSYQVVNFADRVIRSPLVTGAVAFLAGIKTDENPLAKLGVLLDDALSVFNNAADAVRAFKERVMPPPMDAGLAAYIAAMIQFAYQVVNFADRVIRSPLVTGAVEFLASIKTDENPLSKLGVLLDDALGVFNGAADAVRSFKERVDVGAAMTDSTLPTYIQNLVTFAYQITRLAETQLTTGIEGAVAWLSGIKDSQLGRLGALLDDALGVFTGASDAVRAFKERVNVGAVMTDSTLPAYIQNLVTFAYQITRLAETQLTTGIEGAVAWLSGIKDSQLGRLGSLLDDALSVFNGAAEAVKTFKERVNVGAVMQDNTLPGYIQNLVTFAYQITRLAENQLATEITGAVQWLSSIKDSQLGKLGTLLDDALSVFSGATDAIRAFKDRLNVGAVLADATLPTYIQNLVTFAYQVARLAESALTDQIQGAVDYLSSIKNSQLGKLGSLLDDALSVFNGATDAIRAFKDRLNVGAALGDTTLPAYIQGLVAFAFNVTHLAEVTLQALPGAVAWLSSIKDSQLGKLGSLLDDALGVFNSASEAITRFAKRVQPPALDDSLKTYITQVVQFAYGVANLASTSLAAVDGAVAWLMSIKDSPLGKLGQVVDEALSAINSGLELKGLEGKLANFSGLNLTAIKPKLDLLIGNVIALAQQFGQAAAGAGITDAWTEAGQRLADIVGNALGSMKDTLDFALRLADNEIRVPSASQISGKLRAILAVMREAVTSFANEADSIEIDQDAAQKLATTVKPITDALGGLIELVQSFTGLNLGMSGYANLRSFLTMIFDVFEDFSPDADKVNAVAAALSTMLGGLQNVANAQGIAIGGSLVDGIVTGIQQGTGKIAGALQGALGGAQLTGTAGAAGKAQAGQLGALNSGGGQTTISNTYITNNIVNLSQVVPASVATQTATSAVAGALFKGNPV
jgi:phage-related protein